MQLGAPARMGRVSTPGFESSEKFPKGTGFKESSSAGCQSALLKPFSEGLFQLLRSSTGEQGV